MSDLNLDTVTTVALVVAAIFVLGSIVSAILLKTIAQKLAVALILALVALTFWTQRTSLQDCAALVRETAASVSNPCRFFGQDVEIPARPGS